VGGTNIAGIALGTVLALMLNLLFSISLRGGGPPASAFRPGTRLDRRS
jgi:hypothetical protein